ncbi:MAG TPA: hypothetical protein VFK05_28615 [Polyangiaceae bacterium]|nr:hypothetical protein [Polyangiaceae bacterium]
MPITVSCPACGSRFSLSDDLYRRRVAGSLVKVKCRHCSAEIAVDATEHATMQSQGATHKDPPPRRKSVTQRGLGTAPSASTLATSSPLPDDRPHDSLPLNSTITPLPVATAAPASLASDSIWGDDEETLAINLDKVKSPAKPELARTEAEEAEELEQIEAEEITASESVIGDGPISESPVSSSGTPTLDALTMEAGGAHVPHGKAAPDEFLVSFGAGGDGNLGAPTIDVTSFASEVTPTNLRVDSVALEFDDRRARTNTVPLFDMNGVLPAPRADETPRKNPSLRRPSEPMPAAPDFSERPVRERKFVVPPEAAEITVPAPKRPARRSRAPLWVGLVAAAGAAGAGFGYREHRMKESLASEAALVGAAEPASTQVVNTQAALPAEAVNPGAASEAATVTPSATPSTAATGVVPAAPATQNVTVATTRNVAPSSAAAVKNSARSDGNTSEQPSKAVPAVEKPIAAEKTIEAHNAPPPAAPDTEFDRDAARSALASAAAQASACRKEGDPSGTASLTITFAPSGRVTSAQIQGPPFSGTATGGCIASTMRRASVPAFSGDYVTVSKTIVIQ